MQIASISVAGLLLVSIASGATLIKPETRIIGGDVVDVGKYEYIVSIRYRENKESAYVHKCAGSIYAERVIITGAQCIVDIAENERVMVVAGANTRTGADGMQYPVEKWIAHPSYSFWTVDYDIGIMILEVPISFAHYGTRSIKIKENRPPVGKFGMAAGWGYREEFGPNTYNLEEVEVPFVSTDDCIASYGVGEITERMICAGYLDVGGKDVCQGDTGGPLVYDNELVGLVSWGRGCARPGYPSVYTFVGSLKQWVDDTISENI